jgi:hypothetical protein
VIGILLATFVVISRQPQYARASAAHHALSWSQIQAIVERNSSVLTAPPTSTPSSIVPDGALLGNGHMNAAIGGAADAQTLYIDASDYWNNGYPRTIGGVTISIPALSGATYSQNQDIGNAEVRSTFATSSATLTERAWISATEDTLVLSVANTAGSTSPNVTIKTFTGGSESEPTTAGIQSSGPNTMWATRTTNSSTWLANAALATRFLNASGATYTTDNSSSASGTFTLSPGQTVEIATSLKASGGNVSGSPWPAPPSVSTELTNAQNRANQLNATAGDPNSVLDSDALHSAHLAWWQTFWTSGATINLGGDNVERYWYTSLYALACTNRAGYGAPGMQMFETNDSPQWGGNWTVDYNYEMPYQGVYSANHVALATPYERGVTDFIPSAESFATSNGFQGVYVVNNIGTGGQPTYSNSYGMKGNAAWMATNFVLHWLYTRDTTWATTIGLPYLIQLANFWDNYLTYSGGQYSIQNSAQNEGSSYQLNPSGDLAWLHYMYPALLDMAQTLNVDSSRWTKWQDIIANLVSYPTFTYNGHTDFKATQDAPGFYGNDANPVNSAFPGNDIGLGSSAANIQTEQNTIYDLGETGMGDGGSGTIWSQGNSFAWIYPAAARVALPDTYARLSADLAGRYASIGQPGMRGNGTVAQGGGGAETFGNIETVDSMLLSSYDGVLRLFPDWPAARNASFNNMLARGAFVVSSSIQNGAIQTTTLTSEQGGTATIQNPWTATGLTVHDTTTNTAVSTTQNGSLWSFATQSGHIYQLTGAAAYTPSDLAQTATATASSDVNLDDWRVGYINDGQSQSVPGGLGWTSSSTTGSNHTEWVQQDFGAATWFDTVKLWPRSDGANAGYGFPIGFTIATSNDATNWTTVVTQTGYPLPSGVQSFAFAPQHARYVRVTGTNLRQNPNDNNYYRMQFAEMGVYLTDEAVLATPTASSSHEGNGWSVNFANDGQFTSTSSSSGWSSGDANTGSNHTEWVQLDFGAPQPFGQVTLYPRTDVPNTGYGFPIDFTIAVSNDGSTWTTVVTQTGVSLPATAQTYSFSVQNARYVRVTGTNLRPNPNDNNYYRMQFAEIGVQ